jgi:hypothetical protein
MNDSARTVSGNEVESTCHQARVKRALAVSVCVLILNRGDKGYENRDMESCT